jgi:hypothetical protein
MVIDILTRHPSTARFISTKLVRRFVSDDAPPALVDRAAARFRATRGDLREVTRTILTSPEFMAPSVFGAKIKTPYEFVVSAVRASGAEVEDARALVRTLQQLGMPLYQCQPPVGYSDVAEPWLNTGALLTRMNFAVALAGNQVRGVSVHDPVAVPLALELAAPTRAAMPPERTGAWVRASDGDRGPRRSFFARWGGGGVRRGEALRSSSRFIWFHAGFSSRTGRSRWSALGSSPRSSPGRLLRPGPGRDG